jgi:cobalt-precorrin-5B (C1)-methyltransferase
MLVRQRRAGQVTIALPAGFSVAFRLKGTEFEPESACCYVIKDAGDDPDVTHGAEIHSAVSWDQNSPPGTITLIAGEGIGRVTKPGLAVPPGQPAINPVPRQMIEAAVRKELQRAGVDAAVCVTLSIPDGLERAGRTLNARLGILDGLSILGTTGVVRPVSHQAWRDTIAAALDVAVATGSSTAVLSGGRTSELAAETELGLPDEAFVLMGDHVGFTLDACRERSFSQVVLSLQFAKLVKVAAGHDYTHAHAADLDLSELVGWARQAELDPDGIRRIELAHTAREALLEQADPLPLATLVAERACRGIEARLPGVPVGILLIDYAGQTLARFGSFSHVGRTKKL